MWTHKNEINTYNIKNRINIFIIVSWEYTERIWTLILTTQWNFGSSFGGQIWTLNIHDILSCMFTVYIRLSLMDITTFVIDSCPFLPARLCLFPSILFFLAFVMFPYISLVICFGFYPLSFHCHGIVDEISCFLLCITM